jgi:hypothetical protein
MFVRDESEFDVGRLALAASVAGAVFAFIALLSMCTNAYPSCSLATY